MRMLPYERRASLTLTLIMIAILAFTLFNSRSGAKDPRIPCWKVRAEVKAVGLEEAERRARAQGATREQITEARRCLLAKDPQ